MALRRRGSQGDPRERRPDRRQRLHQAHRQGPRRHRLPRLVHHQPPAEGRPAQPHLRADRDRHHPHRIHHRPHRRGRLLPRLRRRLDRLRRRLPAQGRRGPRAPTSARSRSQDVTTQFGRLRPRRPRLPRPAADADPRRRARDRARQQALPLALGPRDRAADVPGQRAPRRLHRRARLGAAPPDRDAELPLRPADAGGRADGPQARRRPRPELAPPGEVLPRLRHRARPRRDPARGRPPPLRRSLQGLPRQGGDAGASASARNA